MLLSPEEVLNKPWPKREDTHRIDLMSDLPPEEKDRLRSENAFLRSENARHRAEAMNEKR